MTGYDKLSYLNVNRLGSDGNLSLKEYNLTMIEGDSEDLEPAFNDKKLSSSDIWKWMSWQSSNPDVVNVSDSGTVSAVTEGEATITASIKGSSKTATCVVSVKDIKINDDNLYNITPFSVEFSGRLETEAVDLSSVSAGIFISPETTHYDWTDDMWNSSWNLINSSTHENKDIVVESTDKFVNNTFDLYIFGLYPNTTYKYRTVVFVGGRGRSYILGDIKTFTTPYWNKETDYAVDLGLSVKWSPVDYGASKVGSDGWEVSWGEAWGSNGWGKYNLKSYDYNASQAAWFELDYYDPKGDGVGEYDDIGENISNTQYDHATQYWGSSWRTPTKSEWEELISKCSWYVFDRKIVGKNSDGDETYAAGFIVTGPSGRSIYLPYSVTMSDSSRQSNCSRIVSYYWSATIDSSDNAKAFISSYDECSYNRKLMESVYRYLGHRVRPVTDY